MRDSLQYGHHEDFSSLVGKTIEKIEGLEPGTNDLVEFHTFDGEVYGMFHEQDCSERVVVEDVVGDVSDIIGHPILMAEESSSPAAPDEAGDVSGKWTFYRLGTVRGYVTIRWLGSSNGYCSESVSFVRQNKRYL